MLDLGDYISIFLILLLMGFILVFAFEYAWADYIEYNNFRIEQEKPNFCIVEDPLFYENGVFGAILLGITDWKIKTGFDMDVTLILNETHYNRTVDDFKQCDVFIEPMGQTNSSRVGWTSYHFNNSSHKYSFIGIHTSASKPLIDIGNRNITSKQYNFTNGFVLNTVKHEIGHALGLDHKFTTTDNNFKSVMHPNGLDTHFITNHDIQAVKKLYPNGFSRYYNEPIPERYEP